jgi:hypothetical protein
MQGTVLLYSQLFTWSKNDLNVVNFCQEGYLRLNKNKELK